MNYQELYHRFLSTRPTRIKKRFSLLETHHILPRSLGGTNDSSNLIHLTPREHFFAHLLLFKFNKGTAKSKMAFALKRMAQGQQNKGAYRISSRTYAHIKQWAKRLNPWTDERKRARSETMKQRWANPAFRAKTVAAQNTPEARDKNRASALKQWQDPTVRQRVAEGHRRAYPNKSKRYKELWQDPDYRTRIIQARHYSR